MRRLLASFAFAVLGAQAGVVLGQDMGGAALTPGGTAGNGGTGGASGAGIGTAGQGGETNLAPATPLQAAPNPTITNRAGPGQVQAPSTREARPTQAGPTSAAGYPTQRNDFQGFIQASTGSALPLFGYDLFQGVPSTFAPIDNVPVTPDYVIGPGDELYIRAWGQIDIDYHVTVDRNGTIDIPKVGVLNVAGIRYQDLGGYLKTAVGRVFRNFQLTVTMGRLRSIQVFVVGQASRPGTYTVSSLSTLVNAIFAAGGPSVNGSMRNIELKRGDKTVTHLDLYDLLVYGDKSHDARLLPGDVIYFPPVGPQVALAGAVKTPAIFELKGKTSLHQLIEWAGGLATTADTQLATIERIKDHRSRTVGQFPLDPAALARTVEDGDLVNIYSISPKFSDVVTLRGHVATPLRFPYHPGMRVDDLIPSKDALITPGYYQRQNLAVRVQALKPGQLAADVSHLYDEINWSYAVIERLNKNDLSTTLIPFNLGRAVLEHDPSQNLPLMPGDIVTVFSKGDIGAPAEERPIVVSLEGEFRHAGVYQARSGETLRELVARVGGLTKDAYLYGSDFTRVSVQKRQAEQLQKAITELQTDLQRAALTRAQNVTSSEEAATLQQQKAAQEGLLARLEQLKPTGRIVLELPAHPTVADLPNLPLEDGDKFVVPQRPSMVSVFGTVFNQSSFLYNPDKTVADYLRQAGGPRKEADKGSIYVIKADGSVVSNRESGVLVSSLDSMRLMPGDAIVVPENFERTTWSKDLRDWTQIFYQFGLGAAALKVIKQ